MTDAELVFINHRPSTVTTFPRQYFPQSLLPEFLASLEVISPKPAAQGQ